MERRSLLRYTGTLDPPGPDFFKLSLDFLKLSLRHVLASLLDLNHPHQFSFVRPEDGDGVRRRVVSVFPPLENIVFEERQVSRQRPRQLNYLILHRVSLILHRVSLSLHQVERLIELLRPLVPHSRCRREVTLEHLHPLADLILHRHGLFQRLPDSHGVSLERLDPLRLRDGDLGAFHQRVSVNHRELLHLIDRSLLDHRPHLFPHPRGPPVHHRHQRRAVHRAGLRCRGWLSLGVGVDDIVEAGRSLRRPQDSTERVTGLLLRPPRPALRGRGGELRGILRRGFRLGNLLLFLFFGIFFLLLLAEFAPHLAEFSTDPTESEVGVFGDHLRSRLLTKINVRRELAFLRFRLGGGDDAFRRLGIIGIRFVEFFHVRAPLTDANPFRLGHR